jgi:hypothetical protein
VVEGGGDALSDRQITIGASGPAGGGSVRVRTSIQLAQLVVTAGTGCHAG